MLIISIPTTSLWLPSDRPKEQVSLNILISLNHSLSSVNAYVWVGGGLPLAHRQTPSGHTANNNFPNFLSSHSVPHSSSACHGPWYDLPHPCCNLSLKIHTLLSGADRAHVCQCLCVTSEDNLCSSVLSFQQVALGNYTDIVKLPRRHRTWLSHFTGSPSFHWFDFCGSCAGKCSYVCSTSPGEIISCLSSTFPVSSILSFHVL